MKAIKKSLLVITLLFTVMLTLGGCLDIQIYNDSTVTSAGQTLPPPLLYQKDNEVFMACGPDTVSIGKTEELYSDGTLNATFCGDNSSFFYIKYSGQQTSGKLMKLQTDLKSPPEQIAQGVCAAQVSNDGKAVLYITGVKDLTGDLYLKNAESAPQLIANNALPIYYGFSQQGGSIYYFVLEDSDTLSLYVKKGSDAPALASKHNEKPYIKYGVCLDNIGDLIADEEGRLLYSFNDDYMIGKLYLYSNGTSETISEQGQVIRTLGAFDDLLYAKTDNNTGDTSIWYKNKGAKAEKIADIAYALFAGEDNYYGQPDITGSENDRRFIISEMTGDYNSSEVTLYEQVLGKDKQVIAKSDVNYPPMLSPAKNCIVYMRAGKTYIARKTTANWVESELSDSVDISYFSAFDASGKYFYYISSYDSYSGGTLSRYSVIDGKKSELGDNIYAICICGDTPYAVDQNGDAYRVDSTGMTLIGHNVDYISETRGGVFLETYTYADNSEFSDSSIVDIQFVADGGKSAQSICSGVTELYPYSIEYYPPIEKDPYRALDMLINNAYCYQAQLNGEDYGEQPSVELQQAIELTGLFNQTSNDFDYLVKALTLLNEGFENYQLWQNEAPGDKKELYRVTALLKLGDAIDEYEANSEVFD